MILLSNCVYSQVLISNSSATDTSVNINEKIILYINNVNDDNNIKGFGLPTVNLITDLPYIGASRPSSKIENLRGMLMFVRTNGEAMVFDGQDWSKAFNVESDNISRFKINTVSTTNGQASLIIDPTIDKVNFLADPLKLKTNVTQGNRLYIRQSGVYRLNIDLTFTTSSTATSDRLGVKISVNGGSRFDLLENSVIYNGSTHKVSLDASIYVRQGDYITLSTVPDTAGLQTFTITNTSALTVEKIM